LPPLPSYPAALITEGFKKYETKGRPVDIRWKSKAPEGNLITPGASNKEMTTCLFCHADTVVITPAIKYSNSWSSLAANMGIVEI
jgi:cytochrome c5